MRSELDTVLGAAVVVFALLFIFSVSNATGRANNRACRYAFRHAQTAADTLAVVRDTTLPRCEVPRG